MVEEIKKRERRAGIRYAVENNFLSIKINKPGRIVDISSGGISFEYLEKQEWPDGGLSADVLYGENDFYLDNIPLKEISDHEIVEKACMGRNEPTQNCGFQFGTLSKEQKDQLDYFIKVNCKCHSKKCRN